MHQGELNFAKHHHFRVKYTELNEIYIFQTLRTLAFTFIVIFIPIYLLNHGFSIQEILIYYILFYLFEAFIDLGAVKLIRHIGPKHTIALCVPPTLVHFWLLQTLPQYNWPIWFLALVGSMGIGLFWQAYHYDFSKSKRKNNATQDVSRQYVILNFVAAFAPFVGGFMATNYGENILFTLVIILLLIGTMALFKTGDKHAKTDKLNFNKLDKKCLYKDIFAYVGYSWEAIASIVFWPLFVFLIVKNYQDLGLVTSISMIIGIFIISYVGKKSDGNNGERIKYLRAGGFSKGIIYFTQTLANSFLFVFLANIIRSVANSIQMTPWISEYYLHADEASRSEYLFIMELTADLARAFMFGIILFVSYYLSLKNIIILGVLFGGFGSIIAAFLPPAKCEIMKLKNKNIKVMPRPARKAV